MSDKFRKLWLELIAKKAEIRESTKHYRDEINALQVKIDALVSEKRAIVAKIKEEEKELPDLCKQISALAQAMNDKRLSGK